MSSIEVMVDPQEQDNGVNVSAQLSRDQINIGRITSHMRFYSI
ncbi:hypothetical protein [Corynebacterium pseudotuberculosis]|nr:hypothetical protein [Corynebacterium pseudotuberculosis]AEK92395.1 Hypothetical protein CpPAT10_1058a [Corynebacterium pseudotuberculosis PAT10]AEX39549.1 Hypothetical protein Cp3995_1085 [Corynebacterium pseudotuberculosis 3/99-5]AFF22217.1 Hypothetical protein CpP54B96_1079 [Corynebacterium pseudotuberculosis P54B96]AFH52010.1 Hypothetical protein Cp267_1111 [Corynebacterium pseudotuberculosis 267]AIG07463.1 hypothetical protein CPTA_01634 [Corynebacterium pseudotuberculosis]